MKHKQVPIILPNSGETIQVDKGLEDLILHLNQSPELETHFCCKGESGRDTTPDGYATVFGSGYVVFGGPSYVDFAAELMREIQKERARWYKDHQHVCRGCRGLTLQLIADGSGIEVDHAVFRWAAWDKDKAVRVLKAAYDRLALLVNLTNAAG